MFFSDRINEIKKILGLIDKDEAFKIWLSGVEFGKYNIGELSSASIFEKIWKEHKSLK